MLFLQMYLVPIGRIGRKHYWLGSLGLAIGSVLLSVVLAPSLANRGLTPDQAASVISLLLFYPLVVLNVNRWHDRDKSGWWVLIGFVPVIGWIWTLIELGLLPGTDGENRFGPDPNWL